MMTFSFGLRRIKQHQHKNDRYTVLAYLANIVLFHSSHLAVATDMIRTARGVRVCQGCAPPQLAITENFHA